MQSFFQTDFGKLDSVEVIAKYQYKLRKTNCRKGLGKQIPSDLYRDGYVESTGMNKLCYGLCLASKWKMI